MRTAIEILLVEDEPAKGERILATLTQSVLPTPVHFTLARSYEGARDLLKQSTFDVMILDLHIPGARQTPSPTFAIALLQELMQGVLNSPTHVIGLTQHEQSALVHHAEFSKYMFSLEVFSYEGDSWAKRIADKLRYIFDAQRALSRYAMANPATDYVVLVARYPSEFEPIARAVRWVKQPESKHVMLPAMEVRHGYVKMQSGEHRSMVLTCMMDMGLAAAAALTTQLIYVFRPKMIAMLGMCCGFRAEGRTPSLNDIVIADEVACWDEGKYLDSDGDDRQFLSRAQTITLPNQLANKAKIYVERRGEELAAKLSKSPFHTKVRSDKSLSGFCRQSLRIQRGRVLSGLNVVSDQNVVKEIIARSPSAMALDMETYGVYKAAKLSPLLSPNYISIKGVADFGFGKHGETFDKAQKSASTLSYKVFEDFLEFLEADRSDVLDKRPAAE